jgi:hypothetical protein
MVKVKPISSRVGVNDVYVTIEPIKTREGRGIIGLYVSDGRVIAAYGSTGQMGSSFFEENFSRETIRQIKRIGKQEWARVMGIMESINFYVVSKKED